MLWQMTPSQDEWNAEADSIYSCDIGVVALFLNCLHAEVCIVAFAFLTACGVTFQSRSALPEAMQEELIAILYLTFT